MQIKAVFKIDSLCFKADLRRTMVSYLKNAIQQYDENIYGEIYNHNKIKEFTFSLYLPGVQRKGDVISLSKDLIIWEIRTNNDSLGINFYNALLKAKGNPYPFGTTNIRCTKANIYFTKDCNAETIIVRFKSPLVIRKRIGKKDNYYTVLDHDFTEKFKEIVHYQIKSLGYEQDESLNIKVIEGKRIMDQTFGLVIPGSTGVYLISGKRETLNLLNKVGAGSRRGEGFGMFDILTEVSNE